ncbi:hypothetical protein CC80DRAFT_491634 [Byssothecium circinans]|uniref:Uncharacterized protein n=1 Tax=Byssothecium circinans TaxID=147558 RepID=A0A6A5TYY4_9PLEO|nr:hypothetical protein CC80DRAFT_491634 [Byssothecium circinans]
MHIYHKPLRRPNPPGRPPAPHTHQSPFPALHRSLRVTPPRPRPQHLENHLCEPEPPSQSHNHIFFGASVSHIHVH